MSSQPARELVNAGLDGQSEFEFLLTKVRSYNRAADVDLISRAYFFSESAHKGQKRRSGEPFIHHCIEVAKILAGLRLDEKTIAAGLLHDVMEDTETTYERLAEEFGEDIASLISGVTKIGELKFKSREIQQAEYFRKLLLSLAKDIRVILIKFADRLHNMRTLEYMSPEEQRRISMETIEIYAPLAHRFGIASIKYELEDLSFKYLDPEMYRFIEEKISLKRAERERQIEEIKGPLEAALRENGIKARITGRPKHFYSIYRKMKDKGRSFEEIYDLLALRVIVGTVRDCYHVLGIVHTLFTPVEDRFKDYIATPKSNMYQSLHTTVIDRRTGQRVEIQIRTEDMHKVAETGIAAHWRYKEGTSSKDELDSVIPWVRQFIDWQRETSDSKEFMEELKIDLFQDEIFVFTPKGDLKHLPKGATPIDFAFSVHSDIGYHCFGAKVNGQMVPLSYELKSGDTVEIITSAHQKPNKDWLSIVKSARARTRIKRWLKNEEYTQSVRLGKEIFGELIGKLRIHPNEDELSDIAMSFGFNDIERLYAALGNGEISVGQVEAKLPGRRRKSFLADLIGQVWDSRHGVRVKDIDNPMIQFAKCCHPVPGDDIVGFITRGRGISIHRSDCANARESISRTPERRIDVEWDSGSEQIFPAKIMITANDRKGLLSDITSAIAESGVNIRSGEFITEEESLASNRLILDVKNLKQLNRLMKKIREVKGVIKVERVMEADGRVET